MTTDDVYVQAEALREDLFDFLRRSPADDAAFDALALRLFAHQFRFNTAFNRYCVQQGRTPRTVRQWQDIPAVPIDAFKDSTLSCLPADTCARTFMTSGTTRAEVRGRHYHPDLRLYDASMTANFAQRFMRGAPSIRMAVLFPDETLLPNSSLAHYLALAHATFGTADSAYVMDANGLDVPALIDMLAHAERSGEPLALLGASYSLVHALDALGERRFALPAGSRILDTGGFKGQSRELSAPDFYAALGTAFGVAPADCINMYGMTELSTQFYDEGNATLPAVKSGPAWIRTRVIDPLTGADVPDGERGVLAHTDLCNINSVVTILTEDVGERVPGGFLLHGRAQGADAKGCSLVVDAFLRAVNA
ncbi:LuxE/PaaK family acyltransferase [Verticiella alkaliphila]|uniref:LuxE/PaaK family acyltransferase n=1 Tax=Verticiella alkaliphila TaxID=2779529 RepID=UPI00353051A3